MKKPERYSPVEENPKSFKPNSRTAPGPLPSFKGNKIHYTGIYDNPNAGHRGGEKQEAGED